MVICSMCAYQNTKRCDDVFTKPDTVWLMTGESIRGCTNGKRKGNPLTLDDIIALENEFK